jgi:hypothetical protein
MRLKKQAIISHIDSLNGKHIHYFSAQEAEKFDRMRNPFGTDVTELSLSVEEEEQLSELSCEKNPTEMTF